MPKRDTRRVISNAILHMHNELPLMVDLEFMPAGGDQLVRCTNVRTVDGKRPQFVHDRNGTFVIPVAMIRLIEVPAGAHQAAADAPSDAPVQVAAPRNAPSVPRAAGKSDGDSALVPLAQQPEPPPPDFDEEPDEDLLARIRSV